MGGKPNGAVIIFCNVFYRGVGQVIEGLERAGCIHRDHSAFGGEEYLPFGGFGYGVDGMINSYVVGGGADLSVLYVQDMDAFAVKACIKFVLVRQNALYIVVTDVVWLLEAQALRIEKV